MKAKGYTLVEMVIVMLALAVFGLAFGAFITKGADSWLFVRSRENALGSGRLAMNRMTAEFRRIRTPSNIISMEAAACRFTDIDSVEVTFRQSGDNLYHNNDILAGGLLNPGGLAFSYLDRTGLPTEIRADVRTIRIRLNLLKYAQVVTIEGSARIRNLI